MARKPCGRPIPGGECPHERAPGLPRCRWHWLLAQPADVQLAWAEGRRRQHSGEPISRVPSAEWPAGQRWCSGCQSFVPLFYTSGSRCRSCGSTAAHRSRVKSVYGLEDGDYEALLELQDGRCFICRRRPGKIRLAVDHDHKTGEPRGLLCANNENGCNRAVVANLEAAADGGLAAARRAVEYLEHTPYARLKGRPAEERIVRGLREVRPPRDLGPAPF